MQKLSQTEELARSLAAKARRHTLTPEQISRAMEEADFDVAQLDELYAALEQRGVHLAEEEPAELPVLDDAQIGRLENELSSEGVELSLTALRAFASEEALNELSRLAAQYSDVNCTPEDIHLYLDRIARGMPVASKAAAMSGDEITQYLQSMREKKQGTLPEQD